MEHLDYVAPFPKIHDDDNSLSPSGSKDIPTAIDDDDDDGLHDGERSRNDDARLFAVIDEIHSEFDQMKCELDLLIVAHSENSNNINSQAGEGKSFFMSQLCSMPKQHFCSLNSLPFTKSDTTNATTKAQNWLKVELQKKKSRYKLLTDLGICVWKKKPPDKKTSTIKLNNHSKTDKSKIKKMKTSSNMMWWKTSKKKNTKMKWLNTNI